MMSWFWQLTVLFFMSHHVGGTSHFGLSDPIKEELAPLELPADLSALISYLSASKKKKKKKRMLRNCTPSSTHNRADFPISSDMPLPGLCLVLYLPVPLDVFHVFSGCYSRPWNAASTWLPS